MAKRKKPNDEQGQENPDAPNDADNFGLPEIDYKPLESATSEERPVEVSSEEVQSTTSSQSRYGSESSTSESEKSSTYSYMEEENKSRAPVIIGIAIALVVAVAAFLIYFYVYKPQQEAEARKEQLAKEAKIRDDAEKARLAQLQEEQRRLEQARLDSINAIPKEGTIETLSDRTRRYYVIVSSAIDGDLVMDYAKRLSAKGVSTKIIPPFGKYKFSRLAIGDYDTFATAQTSADAAKTEYGTAVWVLRF